MFKNQLGIGIILVGVGACSYGVLSTVIKLAGSQGFSTYELTFTQSFIGFLGLLIINILRVLLSKSKIIFPTPKNTLKLIFGGFTVGLSSLTYYMSLKYTSVAICIVLAMQSVWMGTVLDFIVNKKTPSKRTLISIALVLIGTVLATNILNHKEEIDYRGILWGLASGFFYTLSLFSSNRIATQYDSPIRSLFLALGSVLIILICYGHKLYEHYDFSLLYTWGLALGFLGTLIPPLFFTRGMPIVGIGLGAIIVSVELPFSSIVADIVLGERLNFSGWMGILIILYAIIYMNFSLIKKRN